jgi:large subunit ribosomal protein L35Ae
MKGIIVNFRSGKSTQKDSHMIISIEGVDSREKAGQMVGKNVEWKTQAGNSIKGTVASAHGNKGAIRVIFEKGMPGQSLGTEVEVL